MKDKHIYVHVSLQGGVTLLRPRAKLALSKQFADGMPVLGTATSQYRKPSLWVNNELKHVVQSSCLITAKQSILSLLRCASPARSWLFDLFPLTHHTANSKTNPGLFLWHVWRETSQTYSSWLGFVSLETNHELKIQGLFRHFQRKISKLPY